MQWPRRIRALPGSGAPRACTPSIREGEVDQASHLVDGMEQVFPCTTDAYIGFVDPPGRGTIVMIAASPLLDLRRITLHPSKDGGVVHHDAAFLHHLGQIAVADAVFAISTHAEKDHIGRKPPALKHGRGADLIKLVRGTAPVTLLQQSRLQVPRKTMEQAAREAAASSSGRNRRPAWSREQGGMVQQSSGCAFWWSERHCRMGPA